MEEHALAWIGNRFWTAEERPIIRLGMEPDRTIKEQQSSKARHCLFKPKEGAM
jgi:hypothetical protein